MQRIVVVSEMTRRMAESVERKASDKEKSESEREGRREQVRDDSDEAERSVEPSQGRHRPGPEMDETGEEQR